ncbi:MAG: PAS domain-containing protein [Candidatus Thorarchaeota archaeon]
MENITYAILSLDIELKILSWNKTAEEIYSWSADEVIGKNFRGIIPVEFPYNKEEDVIREFILKGF